MNECVFGFLPVDDMVTMCQLMTNRKVMTNLHYNCKWSFFKLNLIYWLIILCYAVGRLKPTQLS